MAIPGFQEFLLPCLKVVGAQKQMNSKEIRAEIAKVMGFTESELAEMLPSGTQQVTANRTAWSLVYLQKAGLLTRVARGVYAITDLGKRTLQEPLDRIDINYLSKFDSFRSFKTGGQPQEEEQAFSVPTIDPRGEVESGFKRLKQAVMDDLLEQVYGLTPLEFEKLVLELMQKMGYGVAAQDSVRHVGGSGDGGVDGEIYMDTLGLETVYLQAKRFDPETGSVGRPDLQKFVGSLTERKAKKGVFLTTARFAQNAYDYCEKIDSKIVLIDGSRLVSLMYDFDLAVTTETVLKIKKVDLDFFEE